MFHMQGSTGVTCAIVLSVCEVLFVSEARPGPPPAKASGPAATSERSIHRALTEGPPTRTKVLLEGERTSLGSPSSRADRAQIVSSFLQACRAYSQDD